jgi:hypothetical protein
MDRRKFLKIVGVGTAGLFAGVELPKAEAVEPELVVSKPLTNITVEYMKKSSWRIPFGPLPPPNPEVGDRWWRLGEYGHYEVTTFNGHHWKR